MEKLTEKEKQCLLEYTNDLKMLMEQEHLTRVSDNQYSYTIEEVDELQKKIEKIND